MLESAPAMGLRLPDLKPEVQSYVAQLKKSLFAIYAKYDVKNRIELAVKVREGKVDTKDSDKAIELLKVINECGRQDKKVGREFEIRFIEQEGQKLEAFFGRKIEVPPLPEEITPERIEQWEKQKLELHYLPPIDMSKEHELTTWKKEPDFGYLTKSDLPEGVMILFSGWVLVDAREKPQYDKGNQMYKDDEDFLGSVLEELRDRGLIEESNNPQSRFNILLQELEKPEVIAALAAACKLKPEQITIPRLIEFNILGNIYHPEWGEEPSNCSEWFADKYQAGQFRMRGGDSDSGGLECVRWFSPDIRSSQIGFRILARFS